MSYRSQSKSHFVERLLLHLSMTKTNFEPCVVLKKNVLFKSRQDFAATLYIEDFDNLVVEDIQAIAENFKENTNANKVYFKNPKLLSRESIARVLEELKQNRYISQLDI